MTSRARAHPLRRGRVTAAALVALALTGLLVVWNHSARDRRPVLTGRELGRAVASDCAELRERFAALSDFETPEELVGRLREQGRAVTAVEAALARARPDGPATVAYERARDALVGWQDTTDELARLLTRRPSLGSVAEGLATDAAAALAVDDALENLGGGRCVGAPPPVDPAASRQVAGGALLDAAGLRRLAGHDPPCVVEELTEIPFDHAVALEAGRLTPAVIESVAGALDRCLHLEPLLEGILADLGHDPERARCFAAEVAARAGWPGLVEIAADPRGETFLAAVAAGLERCP